MIYAGCPSFFGVGFEDGHVPTLWFLLYTTPATEGGPPNVSLFRARVLDVPAPAAPMTSPSTSDSDQLRLLTLTETARQRAEAAIERERSRSRRPPIPVRTSMTAINLETKAAFPVPEGLYQHISRMSRTPDVPARVLGPFGSCREQRFACLQTGMAIFA